MSTILDRILETKRREVEALRQRVHREGPFPERTEPFRSLAQTLRQAQRLGVIAEIKRKSPSKGVFQASVDPAERARVYEQGGASAISVLTDETYFHGALEDLRAARSAVHLPILRKDFVIDEIQVDEAVSAGADILLLIAAAMPADRLVELSRYARARGLEVLLEVHGEDEVEAALAAEPTLIGINNRDLRTFEVDLATSERVLRRLPEGSLAIAESGIMGREDALRMASAGARGILVGELLMRHADLASVRAQVAELCVPLEAVAK
ncbi:indole-3-glycerol phosphate synthase TrpC [Alicyclobacillus acidocaldarius]|uniref:Indole-3-glycerol phosphate synthase n=1 Tax=Alicyclobacillus acidocaldarius subsp. acidocaldarius (strain ATCC 27009 / DSM 446 / BCRC 14685 / JCM 5260 / KCTC 1825 / NBRC 15652 / NCIMB 11725 / NRRL B-14509 / 104-IA) TaxID=521098 RepID=C8WX60_ALIAD|nr:indole-3-glycerol phosphate synthase TrpC [Alicyclobacillus acidocaldarius]ACV58682.1 Indole-3-glycerol-phosphate synthase [Alicyclobacillus acidocaldarius subsp. acidocaldarius DSM 446]